MANTQPASLARRLVPRTRPLPARKQALFASHRQLLVNNDLVLFLRPGDFSATEWRQLRAALGEVKIPSTSEQQPKSTETNSLSPSLTVLRPGLLPALLRDETLTSRINTGFLGQANHLEGPLAVLTCPTLNPPALSKVLSILSKFSKQPSRNAPPPDPKAKLAPPERLTVLSSLLEQTRVADEARTRGVIAKLPTLDVLRAQVVGLLSAPGSRIAGVLGARSRDLARTIDGFRAGLEETSGSKAPTSTTQL